MKFPHPLALLAAITLLSVPLPLSSQQPCPSGRVSFIFVDNHSIFDPDDLSEEQPFLWAYRLANVLHMRTAQSFLLSELLFSTGDCYDPELLEESERLLRLHTFIATADVYGVEQPDGSWHVIVDTKDDWTTKVGVRVNLEEGFELRGVDLAEENVVGRGITAGVFFREHDERRDLGAQFFTPRLLSTRMDGRVSAGRTRIGSFFGESLFYPFVGEVGRIAGLQLYLRRDEFFPYSLGIRDPAPGEVTHVLLPMEEERMEVTVAGRIGAPGNLTTFGLGVSNATLEFPGFPHEVEVAREGDFGQRDIAPPELAARVERHTRHASGTRLNLLIGQRNIRFERRRGLDALSGLQDVAVGTDAAFTLGKSVGVLSSGEGQPDDLYGRLRLFLGDARPQLVINTAVAVEGRQIFSGGTAGDGLRDVLGEADFLLYWQPGAQEVHTLFLRLAGAGGWSLDQPFQLTLGGSQGVRAFREYEFPSRRRVIASAEHRVYLPWPAHDLVDLGLTLFADGGRGWGQGIPFGVDSGWIGAVGGGLRLGFPAGTRSVVRLDVAFPLGAGLEMGDYVFRVSMAQVLGLNGIDDMQMARSRRVSVGSDVFTPGR